MPPSRPVSPELLLSHAGWVRSLARSLLRDPQAAEDVVQATWVAALEHGPVEGRPLATWLARVARNFARKRMRSEASRGAHEILAARVEGEPSAAALYERATLHRELVEAVMSLDEPYRSTILLRYFEELPPRAIARRERIPVQTVKTRIARALEKLRARLDTRSGGDRTAWMGALAAFTRKPFAVGTGTTAVTIMTTNLKLVGAGALLAAVVATVFVWKTRSSEGPSRLAGESAVNSASPAGDLARASSAIEAAPAVAERSEEAKEIARKPPSTAEDPLDPDRDLHGRVTNSAGRPLRGARIEIRRSEARGFDFMVDQPGSAAETFVAATASDEHGDFRIRLPRARPFDLYADLPGYAERKIPCRYAGENVQVVLTAGCTIFGRVTRKPDGAPCAGAVVHAVPGIVRLNGSPEYRAETDGSGTYRLEGLPSEGLEIDVDSPDAVEKGGIVVRAREGATIERNIALEPGVLVTGVVTDASTGVPIVGAEVSRGWLEFTASPRTDPDGSYTLRGVRVEPGMLQSLQVSALDFATVQRTFETVSADPVHLDFQLRPGHSAKGRVLGPDDRPLSDAAVIVCGRGSSEGGQCYEQRAVRTNSDGTFELAHLIDGAHHTLFLRKEGCGTKVFDFPLDEESRSSIDFGDLRLPEPVTILGRVVDENGMPVPDTYVGLEGVNTDFLRFSDPETGHLNGRESRRSGRTDDQGRFGFCDLSPGTYSIRTSGMMGSATSARCEVFVGEGESRDDLVLVLTLGQVLEGRVVDPAGNPVPGVTVMAFRENGQKDGMTTPHANDFSRADGTFHLQGLEEGKYMVLVEVVLQDGAENLSNARWRGVSAGARDLNFVLPVAAWIEGAVLNPDGAPAVGAQIQADVVEDVSSGEYLPTSLAWSDAQGRFRVKVCASSRVNLQAFSKPWRPDLGAEARDVAAGATDVRLKLAPWR